MPCFEQMREVGGVCFGFGSEVGFSKRLGSRYEMECLPWDENAGPTFDLQVAKRLRSEYILQRHTFSTLSAETAYPYIGRSG